MPWIAEPTTLPRRWVLNCPALWSLAFRAHRPWLELHFKARGDRLSPGAYTAALSRFKAKARAESFEGMFCGAWFFDPAVARITSRLDFLRDIAEHTGARFGNVSKFSRPLGDSPFASATRRDAFDRGEYLPRVFVAVWPI